jgi:hypothetical protein
MLAIQRIPPTAHEHEHAMCKSNGDIRILIVRRIYLVTLTALGIVGVSSPTSFNAAPTSLMLEGTFLTCFLLLSIKFRKDQILAFALFSAYILVNYSLMEAYTSTHILDFIVAYKAFFYMAMLSFFAERHVFDRKQLSNLVNLLLLLFFIKYAYSRALAIDPLQSRRPGLLIENNFELILLSILYYISTVKDKQNNLLKFSIFSSIVLLSGSRSAILSLLIITAFVYIRRRNHKALLGIILLVILSGAAALIFSQRLDGGSIEDIDRFKFMMAFITEIQDWTFVNLLFGSFPITPLSESTCFALSYYDKLFSYANDGRCYSVVLHSYLLRVLFDHGLFGLLLVVLGTWKGLARAGFEARHRFCILGILFSAGLSVSSFNSIFAATALAITFSFRAR